MGRACRYCKSPAVQNPCWYYLDNPSAARCGWDQPCYGDDYSCRVAARDRRAVRRFLIAAGIILAALAALLVWGFA